MEENEKKETKKTTKKGEALVTCRVLFISVLDKIYLVMLLLLFAGLTIANFSGNISSISYGFWNRVGYEIVIVLGMVGAYFLFNWFYKCAVKTILCLTNKELYKESYVPFIRSESSIALSKIAKVSTCNYFGIFRCVIIHQYNHLPMIFFTWNNQELKDKLDELLVSRTEKVKNEYVDKNILAKEHYVYLKYIAMILGAIICLIGIVKFFSFLFSAERRLAGTYTNQSNQIVLMSNGNCDIDDIEDDAIECNWSYNKDTKKVSVTYAYYNYYWSKTKNYNTIMLDYNSDNKTISYYSTTYSKN